MIINFVLEPHIKRQTFCHIRFFGNFNKHQKLRGRPTKLKIVICTQTQDQINKQTSIDYTLGKLKHPKETNFKLAEASKRNNCKPIILSRW